MDKTLNLVFTLLLVGIVLIAVAKIGVGNIGTALQSTASAGGTFFQGFGQAV